MQKREEDMQKQIAEIHEVTLRNTRMLRAMRRSAIIRSTFIWAVIGILGYYGYTAYNQARNTFRETKQKIDSSVNQVTDTVKNSTAVGKIVETLFNT